MAYKQNKMNEKYLESENNISEDDLDKSFEEIISNADLFDNMDEDVIAMGQAYDYLEQAEMATTEKEAIKYVKKALEICPECLDAQVFLTDFMEEYFEIEKQLLAAIKSEEKRLRKKKYFEKDNIGFFYGLFETRPYIRAQYKLASLYANTGKTEKALDVCLNVLKLNENDNTGIRYLLMALYAHKEDEKALIKVYKKFNEDCLETLIPFLILYLKSNDYKKAKVYLDKINKANKYFKKVLLNQKVENSKVKEGYYSKGDSSEIYMYFENYVFLLISAAYLLEFVKKDGNV